VRLAADAPLTATMGQRAWAYAQQELSFATTMQPLRTWVNAPSRAPDQLAAGTDDLLHSMEFRARTMMRQAIWRMTGKDR